MAHDKFPANLTSRQQWLVWKFIQKVEGKKPSKIPFYASGEIRRNKQGSDDDRAMLVDYETAVEAMHRMNADGLGFAFLPGDGLIGIDLDAFLNSDDERRKQRGLGIIKACGSYTEFSPSGNGVHIIVEGTTETFKSDPLGIEVFCGSQFFTMTGRKFEGTPDDIKPINHEVLVKLRRTVKGDEKPKAPPPAAPAPAISEAHKVESALAMISPDIGYHDWVRIGMAIHAHLGEGAMDIWDRWSSRGSKYSGSSDIESHWRSFEGDGVTGATLFKLAQDNGWRAPRLTVVHPAPKQAAQIDPETGEVLENPAPANDNAIPPPLDVFAEHPAPPMKREMLPSVIARYAYDEAELVGVQPAMIAMPAIVACAAALHDDIRIQPKRHETGWTESARLWCALVGSPSVRKSPAIKRATTRLRKIDMDLHDENSKAQGKHAEQMEAYKEAKKEAKKTGTYVAPPEPPANNRMVVEDITVEALSEVLKDNSRGVMCIQDELTGWFGSMDAYNGGKAGGKDRAHWLEAYNGGGRVVDRVMRGTLKIPNWSVSMIGGIQPDAIRRIAQNMPDDGLMQRFMIVIGGNAQEHDRSPDHAAKQAFSDLIDHLYSIKAAAGSRVVLSEEAHQVREALNRYANEFAEYPAIPGGLRSHLGKWSGLFARLLLVYHTIDCAGDRVHPCSRPVSGDTAKQVDCLMRRFLLPHAFAYYTDVLGASGDLEHVRWIAGHILSKGLSSIQNRELMQSYKQWRGLDDWRKSRIMLMLEDMGWLTAIVDEGKFNRRGASAWSVNPVCHDLFKAKAIDESQRRERVRAEILALQQRQA